MPQEKTITGIIQKDPIRDLHWGIKLFMLLSTGAMGYGGSSLGFHQAMKYIKTHYHFTDEYAKNLAGYAGLIFGLSITLNIIVGTLLPCLRYIIQKCQSFPDTASTTNLLNDASVNTQTIWLKKPATKKEKVLHYSKPFQFFIHKIMHTLVLPAGYSLFPTILAFLKMFDHQEKQKAKDNDCLHCAIAVACILPLYSAYQLYKSSLPTDTKTQRVKLLPEPTPEPIDTVNTYDTTSSVHITP